MKDVTHHGIEVRHNLWVTVVLDHANTILKRREGLIELVLLIVGNALIIVESHLVGVILASILTERHHTIHILFFPGVAHKL